MNNSPTLTLGCALIKYYGYGSKSSIVVQFPNADDHIIINMLSKRNTRSKSYSKPFDHKIVFATDGYEEKTFESCAMKERHFMEAYCWKDLDTLSHIISKYIKQSYYFKTYVMTNNLVMTKGEEDGSCKYSEDKTPGYAFDMQFVVNVHIKDETKVSYYLTKKGFIDG